MSVPCPPTVKRRCAGIDVHQSTAASPSVHHDERALSRQSGCVSPLGSRWHASHAKFQQGPGSLPPLRHPSRSIAGCNAISRPDSGLEDRSSSSAPGDATTLDHPLRYPSGAALGAEVPHGEAGIARGLLLREGHQFSDTPWWDACGPTATLRASSMGRFVSHCRRGRSTPAPCDP